MQQTTFPIEVIIHDDASTDGTKEILEEYTRNYPNVFFPIYQTENQYSKGVRSMNAKYNFPRCSGKYIAICEGDDYWNDPLKLQQQVDFLESNPAYFITGHDAKIIDEEGKVIRESKLPEICKRDCSSIELQKCFFILTLSMCFRNYPELKYMPSELFEASNGDTFMTSYFGQFGTYKYLPNIIPATYRLHANGIWAMKGELEKQIMTKNTFRQLRNYYSRTANRRMELYHSKMLLKFSGSVLRKRLSTSKQLSARWKFIKEYIVENQLFSKPSILLKSFYIHTIRKLKGIKESGY
jgi:glycosyltransferase involved in cell wall biosynthesis